MQQSQTNEGVNQRLKPTIFVFDATFICTITARLWLELNVAEFQHSSHQLQHRLHLVLHEAHNLHGILGGQKLKEQVSNH